MVGAVESTCSVVEVDSKSYCMLEAAGMVVGGIDFGPRRLAAVVVAAVNKIFFF